MRKTNLKKLAAVVLSAAMVLSMGGMTAFAEDTTTTFTASPVKITKNLGTDINVYAPTTSFEFAIKIPTVAENEKVEGSLVEAGKDGGAYFSKTNGEVIKTKTIFFTDTNTYTQKTDDRGNVTGWNYADDTTSISFDATVFSKPGIYRYLVEETSGNYDGMTYDDNKYYLDLYVQNKSDGKGGYLAGYEVAYVVVRDVNDADAKSTEIVFNNDYTTYELTVDKLISGNQANMSAKFPFTITINGKAKDSTSDVTEEYYTIVYTKDEVETIIKLKSGETSSALELGQNDTIVIYGISEHDTFTVVETTEGQDEYKTTYTLDDQNVGTKKETNIIGNVTSEAMKTSNHTVLVENNRNVGPATGIALTFAPYALLVTLAGVFGFFFLRKKREDEV